MNTETGQIKPWEEVQKLEPAERAKYVEVKRDLTRLEAANQQLKLYSPCGCGSGKKFKFCCHKPKAPNGQKLSHRRTDAWQTQRFSPN
jgi:hypothetical protein